MADPPTPPHTPASSSKGTPNVNQGNVRNSGIRNNGGVVTGNVAGFNTIVGTLNITVDSAANLTDNIQSFTARVATAAERLRDVETRIRATSQLLSSIRDLVVARAAKDDITINRDFRVQNGAENASGISSNEGETGGIAASEGARGGIEPGQPPAGSGDLPEPNILEKPCFRDLVNASKSAAERFDRINTKIREAFSRIEPMRRGQNKVELSEEDRQRFFLTERDIDDMERQIESHKLEVHIALTAFEATMGDKRSEAIQLMILEMFKEIKRIGEYFLHRVRGPRPAPDPQPGPRGPIDTDNIPQYRYPIYQPDTRQGAYPYIRPLIFPDLSRLTSLYLGWTFTKGRPPFVHQDTRSTQPSWRWALCTQMALSTEELFLKVLAQTTKRSKLRRSIQDDCKDLLRTSVQRLLVDNLIRDENMNLSIQHPFLELKLAGLSCKKRRTGFFSEETKSIEVILKTEWAPEPPRRGPMAPGAGGGPSPPPPPPPPPGFDDSPYGPGRPLGPGGGGGASGPGHPPGGGGSGPGRSSQIPQYFPGGNGKPSGQATSSKTHPQAGLDHYPPDAGPSKSTPEIVSREPRMHVVRKKAKGKAAASDSESSRRVFVRDRRGVLQVYAENRRPTSSYTEDIPDGPSASPRPDRHPPPRPMADVYASNNDSWAQTQHIPGGVHTHTYLSPPPPPPERLYRDEEPQEYFTMPPRPPAESIQVPARDMTIEQEKQVIEEIFAEWEDGVQGKTTRPSKEEEGRDDRMEREDKKAEEHRTHLRNSSSATVPRIGPTRRMMMEVEQEAEKQETIEKKMRAMHTLEEPRHQYQTREPRQRHRSSYTSHPRRSRGPEIVIDGDVDAYGYGEVDRPYAEAERYYQNFAGYPSVVVPGPLRGYGAPVTESQARESHYAQVDAVDPRVVIPGPSERPRVYFGSPVVESHAMRAGDSEGHARVRVTPTHTMERERARERPTSINVVVTPGPERHESRGGRRIIETRSPRARSYESDSDEWSYQSSD